MESPQDEVLSRLAKLERENKRYRFAGMVFVLFVVAVLTGAAQTGRRTLTASEFILQDDEGHRRAALSIERKGAALVFFDESGRKQMSLSVGNDLKGVGHASLALGEGAVNEHLVLAGTGPDDWVTISDGGLFLRGKGAANVLLTASGPDSPYIEVNDSQGYSTDIGVTETYRRTGESLKSSAASLVLLGKDKRVLWSAP